MRYIDWTEKMHWGRCYFGALSLLKPWVFPTSGFSCRHINTIDNCFSHIYLHSLVATARYWLVIIISATSLRQRCASQMFLDCEQHIQRKRKKTFWKYIRLKRNVS